MGPHHTFAMALHGVLSLDDMVVPSDYVRVNEREKARVCLFGVKRVRDEGDSNVFQYIYVVVISILIKKTAVAII